MLHETFNETFKGKKTYAAAALTILGALTAYLGGEVTMYQALLTMVPAIFASTLRHGIKTAAIDAAKAIIAAEEAAK